ncbi:MAG: pyruvate kinase, partial [Verrucomicrobiales bacterium]
MLRKTKIIATLGPATEGREEIDGLIEAGASIFRLNMSHASHEWTRAVAAGVRERAASLGIEVALLMDLQGPAIRTGELAAAVDLETGDHLEIRRADAEPGGGFSTTVNYNGLMDDVSAGDRMLVDNGVLQLRVVTVAPDRIGCEVLTAGTLGSRRHINLPGVKINLPALSAKDRLDLELAIELEADFVAMSFVRDAGAVEELGALLRERGSRARIVAKIEDQEAVRNLDEIIVASNAVMVARGDLGIEVNIEELPIIQRLIVKRCARLGRKVIVATHLLESMIDNPIP